LDSLVRSVLAFSKTTEYEMEKTGSGGSPATAAGASKAAPGYGNILVDLEVKQAAHRSMATCGRWSKFSQPDQQRCTSHGRKGHWET